MVLSFATAAQKGIICPYKVIISLIDKQMVDDFSRTNGITLVEGDEIGARWVANLIALEQAAKKVDAKKIISFHSRVTLAQEFATREPNGIGHYLTEYDVRHVNGSQSSSERSQIINAFANSDKGIITNARCLTEGVNIPAVDMVAFIDPRQSRIDIAQAVGRAMRKPRGPTEKQVGYVLVPLFAGISGESLEDSIHTEKFDAVAEVLNALQEHDENFVDIIDDLKRDKGEGKVLNFEGLLEKIDFIGPVVGFDRLVQSISIEISDSLGNSWYEWYGRLVKYKEANGNCLVPKDFISIDGFRLGNWVAIQRAKSAQLSEDRRSRLDQLGFVWDALSKKWEEAFTALKKYQELNGDCWVPAGFMTEDGLRLGTWVRTQRDRRSDVSEDRISRLDSLGFVWDPFAKQWEQGYIALKKYKELNGDCLVPKSVILEGGFRFGAWVVNQRRNKESLSVDRLRRLNELGFIWDVLSSQWEEGYRALKKYKEVNGNTSMSMAYVTEDGYRLGVFAQSQRQNRAKLSEDRRLRLNQIDFVWEVLTSQWEKGYSALEKYKEENGTCLVPSNFVTTDGFRLGQWVRVRLDKKAKLSDERLSRLDKLGFVWDTRDAFSEKWEAGFSALHNYKEENGDCLVPRAHATKDGYRLGVWVHTQRKNRTQLGDDRLNRLDKLGFVWHTFVKKWEEGYCALKKYKEAHGDCLVPARYVTEDGYRLGTWVQSQRYHFAQLGEDYLSRLDDLSFVWDPFSMQWEEGYVALKKYKEAHGDCLVPDSFVTEDDYRLGTWVRTQRDMRTQLSEDRRSRLDQLGFVWDPFTSKWEKGFSALKNYKVFNGDCLVPQGFVAEDGYRLGLWVSNQRRKKDKLSEDCLRCLDELGFVWNVRKSPLNSNQG